jgi:hypothetical protein
VCKYLTKGPVLWKGFCMDRNLGKDMTFSVPWLRVRHLFFFCMNIFANAQLQILEFNMDNLLSELSQCEVAVI